MKSVVEYVKDEGQNEGSPANCQSSEDSWGCEVMGISISVKHGNGLSSIGQYQDQGRHCQTERIKLFVLKILDGALTSSEE